MKASNFCEAQIAFVLKQVEDDVSIGGFSAALKSQLGRTKFFRHSATVRS